MWWKSQEGTLDDINCNKVEDLESNVYHPIMRYKAGNNKEEIIHVKSLRASKNVSTEALFGEGVETILVLSPTD